jgi:hypothetical protein
MAMREEEIIHDESMGREREQTSNYIPHYTPPQQLPPAPPQTPHRGGNSQLPDNEVHPNSLRIVTPEPQSPDSYERNLIRRVFAIRYNNPTMRNYHAERNILREFDLTTLDTPRAEPEDKKLVTQSEELYEATDCAICMDELKNTNKFITRCGHQFCGCCMIKHIRTQNFCPTCRGILV